MKFILRYFILFECIIYQKVHPLFVDGRGRSCGKSFILLLLLIYFNCFYLDKRKLNYPTDSLILTWNWINIWVLDFQTSCAKSPLNQITTPDILVTSSDQTENGDSIGGNVRVYYFYAYFLTFSLVVFVSFIIYPLTHCVTSTRSSCFS